MRTQLVQVADIARVTAHSTYERLRGRHPVTSAHEVPASVDQITADWLTAVLGTDTPGARVEDFALGAGSDGTSSRRALTVEWNEAGRVAGLPSALYSKSTPSLLNRLLVGITGAAGAEALFYQAIRQHLDIGAPIGYHGAWDPKRCTSMVLTDDITITRGATFADAATRRVQRGAAESMVKELARYHGAMWEDPRLHHQWKLLRADDWQKAFNARIGFDRGAILAMPLLRDEIAPELFSVRSDLREALMTSLDINVGGPLTLLHQDVHPGNWFELSDGSLNLYDWQGIGRGGWALDVSYALSTALEVEDRRSWERDLIAQYIDELAAAGGKPPSFDEAFLAYRQQMFRGFIFWSYTFLVGRVSKLQSDAHVRTLVRRSSQAIVDLDSLGSLSRSPNW